MSGLLFVGGLVFLIVGAEALVRGASRLAGAMGIPALIIGLTVVAFGTSAPEFAVSVEASSSGQASLALGNVIGSNIFNVLFILGVAALIAPLVVSHQLIRLDVPLMIGVTVLAFLLALDGTINRFDGGLLFAGLLVYTAFLFYYGRKKMPAEQNGGQVEGVPAGRPGWLKNGLLIVGGLGLLVLGSRWLVGSAVALAEWLGVSELIIGLTIVAAGTSLPEVVTSVVASLRGERDIAVGNVVGSNVFNLMGVLGLAGLVAPDGAAVAPSMISFDFPIVLAVAFACLPIFFTGGEISRWEGGLLLGYYAAYTTYLILAAAEHDALGIYSATMVYFILPITALTLLVLSVIALRKRRAQKN